MPQKQKGAHPADKNPAGVDDPTKTVTAAAAAAAGVETASSRENEATAAAAGKPTTAAGTSISGVESNGVLDETSAAPSSSSFSLSQKKREEKIATSKSVGTVSRTTANTLQRPFANGPPLSVTVSSRPLTMAASGWRLPSTPPPSNNLASKSPLLSEIGPRAESPRSSVQLLPNSGGARTGRTLAPTLAAARASLRRVPPKDPAPSNGNGNAAKSDSAIIVLGNRTVTQSTTSPPVEEKTVKTETRRSSYGQGTLHVAGRREGEKNSVYSSTGGFEEVETKGPEKREEENGRRAILEPAVSDDSRTDRIGSMEGQNSVTPDHSTSVFLADQNRIMIGKESLAAFEPSRNTVDQTTVTINKISSSTSDQKRVTIDQSRVIFSQRALTIERELSVSGSSAEGSPSRAFSIADRRAALVAASQRLSEHTVPPPILPNTTSLSRPSGKNFQSSGDIKTTAAEPSVTFVDIADQQEVFRVGTSTPEKRVGTPHSVLTPQGFSPMTGEVGAPDPAIAPQNIVKRPATSPLLAAPNLATDESTAPLRSIAVGFNDSISTHIPRVGTTTPRANRSKLGKSGSVRPNVPGPRLTVDLDPAEKNGDGKEDVKDRQEEKRSGAGKREEDVVDWRSTTLTTRVSVEDHLPPAEMGALGVSLACLLCGTAETPVNAPAATGPEESTPVVLVVASGTESKKGTKVPVRVEVKRCARCRRGCCNACFRRLPVYCRGPKVVVPGMY